jgi:hypothetical protein
MNNAELMILFLVAAVGMGIAVGSGDISENQLTNFLRT